MTPFWIYLGGTIITIISIGVYIREKVDIQESALFTTAALLWPVLWFAAICYGFLKLGIYIGTAIERTK